MNIQKLELHDAIIFDIEINMDNISILIKCYLNEKSDEKSVLQIKFCGVRSSNFSMDHISLASNARAGNINYWIPKNNGTTFIYLVNGYISINSKKICLCVLDEDGSNAKNQLGGACDPN